MTLCFGLKPRSATEVRRSAITGSLAARWPPVPDWRGARQFGEEAAVFFIGTNVFAEEVDAALTFDPPDGTFGRVERAVMADGNEYNIFQMKEAGRPVQPVYASEGSPMIIGPNGIFKDAPNPNAARLFQSFSLSREAQQLIVDVGGLRSVHAQTVEKAGRAPLKDIKTMKDDAPAVERESEAIKARYTKIFRV